MCDRLQIKMRKKNKRENKRRSFCDKESNDHNTMESNAFFQKKGFFKLSVEYLNDLNIVSFRRWEQVNDE